MRDSVEIADMGFPVFCRGFCIQGTTKAILGLINYPTFFGGVLVNPGDLILGDDDGIVVVNRNECETVLEETLKRIGSEKKKSAQLKKGISSVEINELDKFFESSGLIDQSLR